MNDYTCLDRQFNRLPNELRLIMACLRAAMKEGDPDLCRGLLDLGVDWDIFLESAMQHGVYPVVYAVLKELESPQVPDTVLAGLQLRYKKNSLDMMSLSVELLQLTRLFQRHGIRMIALKGPALAKNLYGKALRENDDAKVRQVIRQLEKFIEVISAKELDHEQSYWREVAILKIETDGSILDKLASKYNFEILDRKKVDTFIVQIVGATQHIDDFMEEIDANHIVEIARTGVTAMEQ